MNIVDKNALLLKMTDRMNDYKQLIDKGAGNTQCNIQICNEIEELKGSCRTW